MARNLRGPERRDLAEKAYRSSLRRVSNSEIGCELRISRQLASTLVREEQARLGRDKEEDREEFEKLLAEREKAIGTYDAIIRHSWQELGSGRLDVNSTWRVGHLNTIVKAQAQIVRILGLEGFKPDEDENEPIEALTEAYKSMFEESPD